MFLRTQEILGVGRVAFSGARHAAVKVADVAGMAAKSFPGGGLELSVRLGVEPRRGGGREQAGGAERESRLAPVGWPGPSQ